MRSKWKHFAFLWKQYQIFFFKKKSFYGQIEFYVNTNWPFEVLYSQTQIQKNHAAVSQVTN